nr:transglutaminase-like cysteine peptidase [uncultured Rhodoferax sp.]
MGSKRAMLVWREMRYANLLHNAYLVIIGVPLFFGHPLIHFPRWKTRPKCDEFHVIRIFFGGTQILMSGVARRRMTRMASLHGVLAVLCCLALLVGVANGAADFDRLLSSLTQRWGNAPTAKFNAWRSVVQAGMAASDSERIKRVNGFFNQQLQFADDNVVWSQPDYWATPMESIGRGSGDCEDFSIAKYFTLLQTGVAPEKLRLIYVRAKTGGAEGAPTQAHMVLAYYAQPDAEPLIMDNLIPDIRPASRRPDLVPVFSFNSTGVFAGIAGGESAAAGGTGRLSRWEDLLRRAKAEGFE